MSTKFVALVRENLKNKTFSNFKDQVKVNSEQVIKQDVGRLIGKVIEKRQIRNVNFLKMTQ